MNSYASALISIGYDVACIVCGVITGVVYATRLSHAAEPLYRR